MKDVKQVRRLSRRQRQVLQYIVQGCHNKTIAHLLGIQPVTVKMHVGRLFKKLGVTNRTKAAVLGVALYDVDLATECDRSRFPRSRPGELADIADAGFPSTTPPATK
jgi:DNA-binding CsgD family transcriptional regulator